MTPRIPGVHPKHGALYLVRRNKWIYLCREEEGETALYEALARHSEGKPDRLGLMFPGFLSWAAATPPGSDRPRLKPATLRDYTRMLNGILAFKFGHMRPDDLTEQDVAAFLEERQAQGAAVAGNRERSCLSAVYEYAMRHRLASRNPCRGVARNTERPRRRYVETPELAAALEVAPRHTGLLLAFGYGTGMRLTDVIELPVTAVQSDGLHWVESKTGKPNGMVWTPWLRDTVAELNAHAEHWAAKRGTARCERLVTNRYGRPWTMDGVQAAMKCLKAGGAVTDWVFRDLRAKAATDAPHDVIGHRGQMLERYRKRRTLRPVG